MAWVAERKDVLSTFFALLSLLCYVLPCARRHCRVAVLQIHLRELQIDGGGVAGLVLGGKQPLGVGAVTGAKG